MPLIHTLFRSLIIMALLLGLLLGGAAFTVHHRMQAPGPLRDPQILYIPPKTSANAIIQQLHDAGMMRDTGLIQDRWVLAAYLWLTQDARRLRAGEYAFAPATSLAQLVMQLKEGKCLLHKWVIPEGTLTAEILAELGKNPLLEGDLPETVQEGSLLPETYFYHRGDHRSLLLQRAATAMSHALDSLWEAREDNLPFLSKEEVVILASIVEKETAIPAERPQIAQVFINRLQQKMRLQADPTVVYAMTHGQIKLDRPLSKVDLRTISPYNTYLVAGLPPGPIANPGRASIHAVLHPSGGKFLYFVACGGGYHAFSESLAEHITHVQALRKLEQDPSHLN